MSTFEKEIADHHNKECRIAFSDNLLSKEFRSEKENENYQEMRAEMNNGTEVVE